MHLKFNPRDVGNDLQNQSLECPVCSHKGSFATIKFLSDGVRDGQFREGIAILQCPNINCRSLILAEIENKITKSTFPYKMVDFNSVDIPEKIVLTFNEALVCFSNQCYFAAGVMIRKTLEELCEIEGALGSSLHQRIEDLKTKITISNDLKESISELKLLGNDSAHLELKHFENIGEEELDIAIEIVKELLKSLYQQKALVERIRSFKKM
jgi:Domain of unknown function (DUF4145)